VVCQRRSVSNSRALVCGSFDPSRNQGEPFPVSLINPLSQEISAKVVYYGPGLSGKTTTLKYIYGAVRPERRGELVSLATEGDRTIFFDFLPLHVERVRGMSVRLQLYTVPGQVFYAGTRKLVLNGADGVVFVADSLPSARQANKESLASLRNNLSESGLDLELFPLVMQYNKRDIEDIMTVREMSAELNYLGCPEFETSATVGDGVILALKEIVKLVVRSLWAQNAALRSTRLVSDTAERESGLADRISFVADSRRSSIPAADIAERPVQPSAPPPARRVSFAALWEARDPTPVTSVEDAIGKADYSLAVRLAATGLADVLEATPGPGGAGVAAKAGLLGLDGRDYLRLCKLATAPDGVATQREALFALHLLVAGQLKATTL
jgi:mutual gliding-motility protein MglA